MVSDMTFQLLGHEERVLLPQPGVSADISFIILPGSVS